MCSPGLLYDTIIGYTTVHCIHSYDNIFLQLNIFNNLFQCCC